MSIVVATIAMADQANAEDIRIATFNVSLYGTQAGEIRERLSDTGDRQAKRIASIVQTIRPDILLINELDYEPDSAPAKLLAQNYFGVAQQNADGSGKLEPIDYPYLFSAPSNTGVDSTLDLNNDGKLGTGSDAWGYGVYPGQYSMTVYSRHPIDAANVRSFQKLRWSEMPSALRPIDPETKESYYDDQTWSALRLSSKNHVDVPVRVGDRVIHVLASHPTPPVFDGAEDRNGCRNHDEVEFWNQYFVDSSDWIKDDSGVTGGLASGSHFVVMGDLNADPIDGSGRHEAIRKLVGHPLVAQVEPKCSMADAAERVKDHKGNADIRSKTADFGRNGFMRVDFVLPSRSLDVVESGVFWPTRSDLRSDWIKATDHRMVWIEIK